MSDDLRPANLSEYQGQTRLKRRLLIHMTAALKQVRPLEHVLLTGTPGSGKTSLSQLLGEFMDEPFHMLTMPVTEKTLEKTVNTFAGILLLDELHAASKAQQEALMPLLEFGYLETTTGERIPNGWITIIGATTEPQNIIPPLFDRFPIKPTIAAYSDEDMAAITASMARKAEVSLSDDTLAAIGKAAAGVPRNARQMVLMARDLELAFDDPPCIDDILGTCETYEDGLTLQHLRYLGALVMLGGKAGVMPISAHLQLSSSVCMVLERLLLEYGMVTYSGQGRQITDKGRKRLRKEKVAV